MKGVIFLKVFSISFVFFVGCYPVERNCSLFRTGIFSYSTLIDNKIQTSIFIRDSLYEIELFENAVDSSTIRWVNDCEFILTKLRPKDHGDRKPIRIKILTTSLNDHYTFEYSQVGDDKNLVRGTVYKTSDSTNSDDLFEKYR